MGIKTSWFWSFNDALFFRFYNYYRGYKDGFQLARYSAIMLLTMQYLCIGGFLLIYNRNVLLGIINPLVTIFLYIFLVIAVLSRRYYFLYGKTEIEKLAIYQKKGKIIKIPMFIFFFNPLLFLAILPLVFGLLKFGKY